MWHSLTHWVQQNGTLVVVLGFLGTLITVVGFFWNALWRVVMPLQNLFRGFFERFKSRERSLLKPDLRFVPMSNGCAFGVIPNAQASQPNAHILTHWRVTNASLQGVECQLVEARLLIPRSHDQNPPQIMTTSPGGYFSHKYETLPCRAIRHVSITCHLRLPEPRLKKPLTVQLVVEDNLSNKYKLRKLKLRPIVPTPPNIGQNPPGTLIP